MKFLSDFRSKVRHPNILLFLGMAVTPDRVLIVMERAAHGDALKYLKTFAPVPLQVPIL